MISIEGPLSGASGCTLFVIVVTAEPLLESSPPEINVSLATYAGTESSCSKCLECN
jgi:hypothetical protein